MDETWEHLWGRARLEPAYRRETMYRNLLSKPTYVLHVGPAGRPDMEMRSQIDESLSIWADQDPAFGALWVPVFTDVVEVSKYVTARELSLPEGQEFYWMAHEAGRVFGMLQTIDSFAGIRLDPGTDDGVALLWPEVNALASGRIPAEAPFRYELALQQLKIPRTAKVRISEMDPKVTGQPGVQAFFKDAGEEPELQEMRSWVALRLGSQHRAQDEVIWTPCRHFAMALRSWVESERRPGPYADALVRSLMGFEMYGEAEAVCDWLSRQDGNEAYAWVFLSAIYGRTGRLDSCAKLCEKGIWKYKKERAFYLNQARAYAQLDDRLAAQEAARRGLAQFPGDAALLRFL